MVINIFSVPIVTSLYGTVSNKNPNTTPLSSFGKYIIRGRRYSPLNRGRLLSLLELIKQELEGKWQSITSIPIAINFTQSNFQFPFFETHL